MKIYFGYSSLIIKMFFFNVMAQFKAKGHHNLKQKIT